MVADLKKKTFFNLIDVLSPLLIDLQLNYVYLFISYNIYLYYSNYYFTIPIITLLF